jgi:uncharacterized repeat protein (TIGR01451 family)
MLLVAGVSPLGSHAQTEQQSFIPATDKQPEFVPGHVLVRFRPGAAAAGATASRKSAPARVAAISTEGREIPLTVENFGGSDVVEGLRLARVAPEDTLAAVEALRKRSDVLYAEPDYIRRKDATPNDTRYAEQWALKNTGQSGGTAGADIHAEAAWDTTTGSRQVVVAVLDEGVDIDHPDLKDNIWTNPAEVAGNGTDDDGDGFADDVHGWDFVHNDNVVFGDTAGTYPPPSDYKGDVDDHGTHVAGTIGATGNNGQGVAGVNWQVSILPVKVLGPNGGATSDIIAGYDYVKKLRDLWDQSGGTKGANVRVTNNSYGGVEHSQAEQDAIHALAASQILFVAAAGNDTQDNDRFQHFPANYDEPNVISVAATDRFDTIAHFSDYGARTVHMAAPGEEVLSTTPFGTYSVFSGTSMAAPHVAGAAALLCAANPNISLARLRAALLYSGDTLPSLSPTIIPPGVMTGRRLNLAAALASAAETDTTPPAAVGNFRVSAQSGRSITLSWTAPGDDGAAGSASLYELRFSDSDLSADPQFSQARRLVAPLPAAAGTAQSYTVKLPFRHTSGFVGIRAVDNAGNAGPISSVSVSVDPAVGDPYTVTESAPQPLSTGGTPLGLVGDDKLKRDYVLPFMFPFFEGSGNGITISTNGTIYLTSPPPMLPNGDAADAASSRDRLLSYRMIAGLWDDLRTDRRPGDDVYVVQPDSNHIIFRWQAVTYDTPLGPGTTRGEHPVSFEIELGRDGTIQMRYGDGNESLLPVAGISAGEPDTYVSDSHTSESSLINLTNAPTLTFALRNPPRILTDLSVSMKGAPNPVQTGQQITYSIDYVNDGPDFDRDVVITDQLPPGTTFASCSGAGTCTAPPVGAGGTVTMKPGSAATFQVMSFTLVVNVTAPAGSKIVNTATASGAFEDPNASNNSATVTTDVVAANVFAGVRAVGAGDSHTLAVKSDGTVWGWGSNGGGQAVNSADSSTSTPMQVGGLTDVVAVSGGGFHSLALKSDGTVWAWGTNSVGQLGRSPSFSTVPQPLGQVSGLSGATAVSAGEFFSLALLKDGTVWTWGDNTEGQLGDGTTSARSAPGQVAGLTNVVAVAAGQEGHVLAVKSDGTVWAWGENRFGELGDGTTASRLTPVQVAGLTNVKAVAAGQHFSLALKQDGTVWTWGGTPGTASPPTQLAELSNIVAVDAGQQHAIALKSDGTVWTWGANFDGELGDGTNQSNSTPRQVSGLGIAVGVAAGNAHSVALLSDGTVRAWGGNGFGQLGDGTQLSHALPVQVSGVLVAAMPAIDPGGGFFNGPVNVRLTSEGAAIHYTLNNQDPTENDPAIPSGSTFQLNQSATLKAKAFRDGYVPSRVSFANFTVTSINPIDTTDFFVRQHYTDFLNRQPDASGLQFWTNNIESCGADGNCREAKRVDTSAAFFLSIEFQQTGYLVYKMYKASFGNLTGKPVAVERANFIADTRQVQSTPSQTVVGQGDWQTQLETNKTFYAVGFVQRPAFQAAHGTQDAATLVNSLFANAGVTPTQAERDAAVSAYNNAGGGSASQAAALRSVAESNSVSAKLFDEAFVLMQYFGYLQRDPDSSPDTDFSGYNFWLQKLDSFGGDYRRAEMVRAFIESAEYKKRFGQ